MRVEGPSFYLALPGIHKNGRPVRIWKIKDTETGEIVKQIPSDKAIKQAEQIRKSMNKAVKKEKQGQEVGLRVRKPVWKLG